MTEKNYLLKINQDVIGLISVFYVDLKVTSELFAIENCTYLISNNS